MIGIIPAAGAGQRIQPLGCSKELLPVGSRVVEGIERPKAISEYLVERMIAAGASQICMVISAEKSDIVRYYAERSYAAEIFYVVQHHPQGLCDALFRAEPFTQQHEHVLIGLPDTVWFPENAFYPALNLGSADVNLVLFPVRNPSAFDAVVCDPQNFVTKVEVKAVRASLQLDLGSDYNHGRELPQFEVVMGGPASGRRIFWDTAERLHRCRQPGARPPRGRDVY